MNQGLSEQLSLLQKEHTFKEQQKQRKEKTPETLTEQDLKELMRTNGPRYVRKKGGAFIQR